LQGIPGHFRSDNGQKFIATACESKVRVSAPRRPTLCRAAMGERLLRKLQSQLRDELLDGEIFYTLKKAKIII